MKTRVCIFVLFALGSPLLAEQTGEAVFYSDRFAGKRMANGALFDQTALTVSHATFPFGGEVRVTNLDTGASVVVRVTDRPGPRTNEVAIVTRAAAERLGFVAQGRARVRLELLGTSGSEQRSAQETAPSIESPVGQAAPRPASPEVRDTHEAPPAEPPIPTAVAARTAPPIKRAVREPRPPRQPLAPGRKPSPFGLSEPN